MNNKELEVIIKKLASIYAWDVEFIRNGCFDVAYDTENDVVFGNYCGVIDFSKITNIVCHEKEVDFLYYGKPCSFRASRKVYFDFKNKK